MKSKTPDPPVAEALLAIDDICKLLKLHRTSLLKLRRRGEYPPPDTMVLGMPRWRITTHNRWVEGSGIK